MRGFLSFDKMIMPVIIKVIFWLSVLSSIIFGFFMIGYGLISSSGSFIQIIMGILSFILGPVIIRVYCEMFIVIFKMQESLVAIRNVLGEQNNIGYEEKDAV